MDDEGVVFIDARDKIRFLEARAGDHLMHCFQCDLCHFRNMRDREPMESGRAEDTRVMKCIRRCNLDALWSREPTTVEHNRRDICKAIAKGAELGHISHDMFPQKPSRPLKDECNMALATTMIYRSLDKGKNETCVQFSTVRSMRAAAGNFWKASAMEGTTVMMRGHMKLTGSTSSTNAEWFENFMLGYHKRVGDVSRPDRAISIELMLAIMKQFEIQWENTEGNRTKEKEVIFPALFAVSAFVASLRGEEVPLMDLKETREKTGLGLDHPKFQHVVLTLVGRFKNEVGSQTHHIPLVPITKSGLNVQVWLERVLVWYGPHRNGPVFKDASGNRVNAGYYASEILSVIHDIQKSGLHEHKGLVEADCNVFEEFGMPRSFRRGSNTRAMAAGVDGDTIDLINRWRKTESSRGRKAHLRMNAHYADIRLLLERFLVYSRAL